MKYELAVKAFDGNKAKQGDIVTVRPHPWNWGLKEIKEYLIVIMDSDSTFTEIREKYDMYDRSKLYTDKSESAPYFSSPQFKIPLADLKANMPDLDIAKVENPETIYQPFKSAGQLVQKFDGKKANRMVRYRDVDTASSLADKDTELSLLKTVTIIEEKSSGKKVVLDGK